MSIAITGASGFIGRQLCAHLLDKGYPFVCLIRESTDRSYFEQNGIKYISLKMGDTALVNSFRAHKIIGVVHLASRFVAEHASEDIEDLIASNILLGTYILDASIQADVKWFLNTGTFWQHYHGSSYDPVNLYAATKQAFEDIARFYVEAHGLKFCTLKLCDTYGPGDTRQKIFNLFKTSAASGEVIEMSAGEQLIDIIHVDQVVLAFIKLIYQLNSSNEVDEKFASYIISSGRQITLRELAREYEIKNNVKLNIKWGVRPYRKREVMRPTCNGKQIVISLNQVD